MEQREVVSVPLLSRLVMLGESEPDEVLAVDMGEWTMKVGYCLAVLLLLLSVG